MPTTDIIFYQEEDGIVPIVDWLDGLPDKARVKCLARLGRLEESGHDIRRPEADLLRDGIYELRIGLQGINYRVLYFFHGKEAAVVSHGLTKKRRVPPGLTHHNSDVGLHGKFRVPSKPRLLPYSLATFR
ncbi:MAG: type II toxin-antitoxin system RelE/ParE family toxin [Isosphaeraceae bacterium]